TTAGAQGGFEAAGLVPDVLPSFDPIAVLDISYPSINGSNFLVRMNENMSVPSIGPAPQIFLSFNRSVVPHLADETFTLITVDPDAPTPQNTSISDVLHLLIANVRVTGHLDTFAPLSNTTALAPYLSPTPPVGSDPHRYTWMLFVQPRGFVEAATPLIPADRISFNFTTFRKATGLGSPVAGTFFRSG
ncbi:phosphatidylethanolamine-binding protein, partial [Vararia minispora EC-137]